MATQPKPKPEPDPPEPKPEDDEEAAQPKPPAKPTGPNNLTFGQKAVGLNFNPSGDQTVDELKRLYAQIIDICHNHRLALLGGSEIVRLWSVAITEAQTAQMWAVKAATWKD